MTTPITTEIDVTGMTCAHCVAAVSEEIRQLDGVHDVSIDLDSGHVVIRSDDRLDPSVLDAAVDEAGYEVVR